MKKFVIFLILLCFIYPLKSSDLYFRHLGLKDGLSQVNILSIYQDEIGTMWFGSSEGLNRFNGESIEVFRPTQDKDGLTQNVIYSLCGNKRGKIYIRTTNDLLRYNIYTNQFDCLREGDVSFISWYGDKLWTIAGDSVFYYQETEKQFHYFTTLGEEISPVTAIYVGDDHTLWIATTENIWAFSLSFPEQRRKVGNIRNGQCFHLDKKQNLWVGTRSNGLYSIRDFEVTNHYLSGPDKNSLSNNQIRTIIEDYKGTLWIGTFYGLNNYDPVTDKWYHYLFEEDSSYSLSHSSIFALYNDAQNTIWVGTYFGGVNYFDSRTDVYQYYEASTIRKDHLSFPFVGKMTEDSQGKMWICTEGGGLNSLDPVTDTFERFQVISGENSITHNNLKCIWYRKETNSLYIGTHTGGLSVFDLNTRKFRNFRHSPQDNYSIPNNVVNEIQPYGKYLAVLTQAGLCKMDLESEKFYPFTSNEEVADLLDERLSYETFHLDRADRLWLANTEGGVLCISLINNKITRYGYQADDSTSIGKFKVVDIFEDRRGNIFFGTLGSGLFRYNSQKDSFISYTRGNHRIPSDYCYYIAESLAGYLILLHNKGLSFFDPYTEEMRYFYTFYQLGFNQGSSIFQSKNGKVFLGGIDGIISFDEEKLKSLSKNYRIYFDKLFVNNQPVSPEDDSGILENILAKTSLVRLKSSQNNITVNFSSSNYSHDNDRVYEYKLQNYDREWIQTTNHSFTYTNLNPGKYTLQLREVSGTQEPDLQISMDIEIRSPFYATSVAYIFYTLLICSLFYIFVSFQNKQAHLKASLEYERKQKLQIEELNQIKLNFFTNISHEFRTPLTLIVGQVEYLLQLNKFSPSVYNRLLRIYKNTWHMRDLITELLDFRKQELGYMQLKVECRNIVAYTKEVFMSFYEYALNRHISYKYEPLEDKIDIWFDPIQMKKVFFNLLSNAFKYTEDGGTITVIVRRNMQAVEIIFKDDGPGIHKDEIKKIFDRFYRADTLNSEFTTGTGIGLAVTKGIVELHKGTIEVNSDPGRGTEFTVTLLSGQSHFSKEEIQPTVKDEVQVSLQDIPVPEFSFMDISETAGEKSEKEDTENKPTILIVEDSREMLQMLEDIFLPVYHVYTASNGKEGLEMTYQIQPDIVLSDVMMPEMSGKEMCFKIKNSVELSHIPVVLLTAQNSVEYTIEGYMYGADDYITKPFNIKLLVSRCNNLVRSRRQLVERFSKKEEKLITSGVMNEQDKQLIERSMEVIQRNFDNPAFDMNMLASELGMGRSKLYIRLKEVTGLTPNEFTLKVKLDEARNMLSNSSDLTVSEVSFKMGFSSARYFSKCFKSFFGVSPQSVKRKKGEE